MISNKINVKDEENFEKKEKITIQDYNEIFKKIFNNIIEIYLEKEIFGNKKRESFSSLSITKYRITTGPITLKKKKTKDLEQKIKNKFGFLKEYNINKGKNIKNDINTKYSSLSIENGKISNKSNEKEKYSNKFFKSFNILIKKTNLSSSTLKTSLCKNFVLKSKLYKLNSNTIKNRPHQAKKEDRLFNYFFPENEKNKRRIISNVYIDDEKEDFSYNVNNYFTNIRGRNETFNNQINISYNENDEFSQEEYSIKNLFQIDINRIKNEINNKENLLISKQINNIKENNNYSKNKINESKIIEKNKNINTINFHKSSIPQTSIINYNINNFENHYFPKNSFSVSQFPQHFQNQKNNQNSYSYNNPYYYNKMNVNNILNQPIIFNQYNININNYFNYNYNIISEKNIANNCLDLLKSRQGCQLLIDKSLGNPSFVNNLLFPKLKDNLKEICCDFIGNSLIQIILGLLSHDNIGILLSKIEDSLYEISLTEQGSWTIQKLIEILNKYPSLLNKFIFELNKKDIGILIFSPYAYHIFIKYLSIIKKQEFTYFIYNYIFNNFLKIAKGKYSVMVVQKVLSESDDNQRKTLLNYILINFGQIINDCHGHFLIQFLLTQFEKRKIYELMPIISKIEENIIYYCKCKYSSSIIEKCIERGDQEISDHILKYILNNYPNSIMDIIINPYGFYIMKKSLNISNKNIKERLIKNIVDNIDKIKQSTIVNKIISTFCAECKEFSDLMFEKNKGNL